MNTRKGYKMLIMALFVAFISLISRSIIYLILSVAIAAIIIFLLSSDKKARKAQPGKQTAVMAKEANKKLITLLWVTTIFGGLSLGYGALFFTSETVFHQIIPLPDQHYSAMIFISVGFSGVLASIYFLLREGLTVTKKAKQVSATSPVFCGHCGQQNNGSHAFCSSCGQKL
ncbi:hypothetical protein RJD24_06740 [Bacillaceae bacterium IKA-2]|jgi:hypothetical protein|nr:hypothetical protein RJD24_06740 [Bacillaceae bacterium IKA-2]